MTTDSKERRYALSTKLWSKKVVELKSTDDRDAFAADFAGVAETIDFGLVQHLRKLTITSPKERVLEIGLDELTDAWRGTLDW